MSKKESNYSNIKLNKETKENTQKSDKTKYYFLFALSILLFCVFVHYTSQKYEKQLNELRLKVAKQEIRDQIIMKKINYDFKFCPNKYEIMKKKITTTKTERNINVKSPKTMLDVFTWITCFDNIPIKTRLTDKILVCEYVKEKIGKDICIPKLKIFHSYEDINFDELPDSFMIKTNHASGPAYFEIVKDKKTADINKIKKKFKKALSINYANINLEPHYYKIEPKVYAEALLGDPSSKELKDFKFLCFHGKILYFEIISSRGKHSYSVNYYFNNNTLLNSTYYFLKKQLNNPLDVFPENLETMKKYAEILSKDFLSVRVDFLFVNNTFYFEELTFTPEAGFLSFGDQEINDYLLSLIDLNKKPNGNKEYDEEKMIKIEETDLEIPISNFE